MTEYADPILATIYALRKSSDVLERMGGTSRVYGLTIPDDAVKDMPQRCVVVKPSGGGGVGVGTDDTIGVSVRRVDIWSYGRTPQEAAQLQAAVAVTLKRFRAGVIRRHLVHWFNYSSGPNSFVDPDFDWNVQVITFQVQLADELTAS